MLLVVLLPGCVLEVAPPDELDPPIADQVIAADWIALGMPASPSETDGRMVEVDGDPVFLGHCGSPPARYVCVIARYDCAWCRGGRAEVLRGEEAAAARFLGDQPFQVELVDP